MNLFLTAVHVLVLVAATAYVIHRLGVPHADRIAMPRHGVALPGLRGRGTPRPAVEPEQPESPSVGARRDHRDGGRGRFPPRRRRSRRSRRTTHHG
ncbi:hypothetical protein [Streptomyces cacaoi]|uniref:hypothetical protein n=1 Tax=Streptomyces cacaoi TaxID=1898 RepID=UPI00374A66D3